MYLITGLYCLNAVFLAEIPEIGILTFIGVWREISKIIKQDVPSIGIHKLLLIIVRVVARWQTIILRHCVDIFIITVSVILTMRFRQIVHRIELLIQKKVKMLD